MTSSPNVSTLMARIAIKPNALAVAGDDTQYSNVELLTEVDAWVAELQRRGVGKGTVCGYFGDYSAATIALFLALTRLGGIAVPFTSAVANDLQDFSKTACLQTLVRFSPTGVTFEEGPGGSNELLDTFRQLNHPGLIVFTSGSTGKPKAILHDLERVLGKFMVERAGWKTVLFLMMDHFGGVNTLLSALAYGGTAICLPDRDPETVCRIIEQTKADLLPTTPTFLNMIVASGAWKNYDLSSIRLITYGAEPMTETTLRRVNSIFPGAQLKQTYGLSELGVLRSQSPDQKSLWLKIGGEGFETRVVDQILQIRSNSSMVGYLNAPSPIDKDGWMSTGDLVEERDGLIRFFGRITEVINVGGQKVTPTDVEAVLMQAENVVDVTVHPIPHPILGQAVAARVSLLQPEDKDALSQRLREYCRERLQKYKIPMRFEIVADSAQISGRAKKIRIAAKKRVDEQQ